METFVAKSKTAVHFHSSINKMARYLKAT